MGFIETVCAHSLTFAPCYYLTGESLCSDQANKNKLCRSWWCHGKLWRPKGYWVGLEDMDHSEHGISISVEDNYRWYYCEDCRIYLGNEKLNEA